MFKIESETPEMQWSQPAQGGTKSPLVLKMNATS